MFDNFIRTLGVICGLVIVMPVVLGSIAVTISRANKRASVLLGGFYGQVIFGGIGVIIHELSHLIMALIFGHHIQSVSLLHVPNANDPNDRGLGHVGHAWNDASLYQKVGNVFIGIAPVIGCTLTMVLSTRYLVPTVYNRWLSSIGDPQVMGQPSAWWQWLLWIVLIVNISIGGYDLSAADLQNSRQGLIALAIIVLIVSFVASLLADYRTILSKLFQIMRPFAMVLVFAIIVNLILWVMMRLCVHLTGRWWIIDRFLVQD